MHFRLIASRDLVAVASRNINCGHALDVVVVVRSRSRRSCRCCQRSGRQFNYITPRLDASCRHDRTHTDVSGSEDLRDATRYRVIYADSTAATCAKRSLRPDSITLSSHSRWRGGATVRHLGLRSVGRGFKSCSRQRCVTTLGKLFTPMCLCYQAV